MIRKPRQTGGNMKKLASLILAFLTAFSLSISSFALTKNSVIPTSTLNKILTEYREALKSGENHVSLSGYGLSGKDAEIELYDFFYRANSELGSISYGKYSDCYLETVIETSSGAITGVKLDYWDRYSTPDGKCDMELVKKDQKTVSERFSTAKSIVRRNMSDAEKALVLYEYIILQANYPLSEGTDSDGEDIYPDDVYTTVGLLCDGTAVCAAYAKLYAILLNEAGIPAITVDCDSINHEWVMAEIDGEWYHFDPTWDDYLFTEGYTSLWDLNDDSWDKGAADRSFFLKSDDEFIESGHPDWDVSYSVNPNNITEPPESGPSGKYDDKFFSVNNEDLYCCTLMNYINGSWYFADLKTMSIVNATYDGELTYIEMPTDYIPKYTFGYGNYLYVCTNSSVLRYDTMSDKFEKIMKVPEDDRKTDSFSEMSIVNDEMSLTTARYTFDENGEYKDASFSTEVYPMSDVEKTSPIIDDMNGDGEDVTAVKDAAEAVSPSGKLTRPGHISDKPALSEEELAMIENAESTGKRMMAFVYLGIAAIFIIIATVAIILAVKYTKKK